MFAAVTAQAAGPITEAALQAFYDEVNASYKWPYEKHLERMKNSFDPAYRAKVDSTITIPGNAPASSRSHVSYDELIEDARRGYDSMQTATVKTMLSKIEIAPDGQSAKLREETKIRRMSMDTPEGTIYGDSTAVCDDEVVMTATGTLQVKASICTMTLTITPEREL
jgi:hypothetical protein